MTEVQEVVNATAETTHDERPERAVLVRKFDVEIAEANGRTIEALCVPYNKPADVADPPDFRRYREMFTKGAFARAVKAPFRVWLNFEHQPGFQNVIGSGVSFEERDEGLYGVLDVDEGQDGDKALRFIHKNVLRSLSVQFKSMTRDVPNAAGVVVRRSVHLDAVALCRQGAYADAQVLAVREQLFDEDLLPIPLNPEIAERCRRLGLTIPQRYEAHPAQTDTPAETGTSADGTRQAIET